MLYVASVCTPCWMLLDVVACCCAKFETGQTFQPTTPNISFVPWSPKRSETMLDPFAQLFQHCWGHARSLRIDYKDLWVVFFPRCTAGPNIVGSCCIRLHTTANTNATTPNIVGATMLGVVAPVFTQPEINLVQFLYKFISCGYTRTSPDKFLGHSTDWFEDPYFFPCSGHNKYHFFSHSACPIFFSFLN